MTTLAYGRNTERAVQALLAKRAAEQRAIEEARQAEFEQRQREKLIEQQAEIARKRHAYLMSLAEHEIEVILAEERAIRKFTLPPAQFERIVSRACRVFKASRSELFSARRQRELAFARHFIMYWACRLTKLSLPDIGRRMGGRDHTTVLHGKRSYPKKRAAQGINLREVR